MKSLSALALFAIVQAEGSAEVEQSQDLLAKDDDCSSALPGEEGQCALNALQRRGMQVAAEEEMAAEDFEALMEETLQSGGSCQKYGCDVRYTRHHSCQCNDKCSHYGNCCGDFTQTCKTPETTTTTAAAATTAAAVASTDCFTTGVYYYPNLHHRTVESSAADCAKRCSDQSDCAHFSYWPDKGCHLQSSSAKEHQARSRHTKGVISGPPSCAASGPAGPVQTLGKCGSIDESANSVCKSAVTWAGKSGVDIKDATQDDFQRLYFCAPPGGKGENCGVAPCHCSKPPCNTCFGGAPPTPKRAGCEDGGADADSIKCKPPKLPMDYKGMQWPTMTVSGSGPFHIFAIGDWGGMDGSLNPIEGRIKLIAYPQGAKSGPSVFPRTRWNKQHTLELCDHKQFVKCYATDGQECPASCGFVPGVDDQPQILVANAMKARAADSKPEFVLNVGDNFYWGGIEKTCGTPMDQISYTAHHQFDQIYEKVYQGSGLTGKPWFSVLGNHDWGGRVFNNGWDQQIAYTWASTRWVMPAPYYTAKVDFPDAGFSVDLFFLDSNIEDAHDPPKDSEHNICGSAHNPPNADCSAVGGPASVDTCVQYFQDLWQEQESWIEKKMSEAKGQWQIAVTHFPCGHRSRFYRNLHESLGLDLLVTGHRHDQELWDPKKRRSPLGGLTCFVTGGGGGISSEATPDPDNKKDWYGEAEYGFYDLTISKDKLLITSINYDGKELQEAEVFPS